MKGQTQVANLFWALPNFCMLNSVLLTQSSSQFKQKRSEEKDYVSGVLSYPSVQLYSPLPTRSPGQQDVFHQQGLDMYQTEKGLHLEILDSIQSLTETPPPNFR